MEKNKNSEDFTIEIGTSGEEAYATLAEWVKQAPTILNEIKKNGTQEDVESFQLQIKMVLEKLKTIEQNIRND